MNKIKLKLFYVMMFLVFTQGMWERLFLFSTGIQTLVDVSILAFIFFQFKYRLKVPGSSLFLVLCGIAFFVGFANGDSVIETFLYLRFLIYTYLIYNQMFSNAINVQTWRAIIRFLIIMILLQGIGALFNILILGDRVEGFVGLMSSLGGTTATVFPLFISTLVLIVYLFSPKLNSKTIIVLVLVLASALLVGYSSGKRGIYFIIPLILLIVILITIPKLIKTTYFKKKMLGLALLGLLIFPVIIFGMVNSRGLNYSLSGNESSFEIISNSLDYADEYESSTDQYGRTIGRSNTSVRILETSLSNTSMFFMGEGYGATKEESTMLKLGYGYGIVGFTRDLISGGFFLCFFTIMLFYRMILINKSIKTKISSILRYSMFLVFLYTHLFYSSDFTVSLKITLILVVLMAFFNSPKQQLAYINFLNNMKLS